MNKPKVIVICGPTASGKTGLAVELAKKINGEIVSCDSMQIYKDMSIGSAKPTVKEMQGIKHYLIDYVQPNERYSVARYKKDAEEAIADILAKNKTPIIVGGTGLYVNALVYGIEYNDIETDMEYRQKLDNIAENEGLDKLYNKAAKIDPDAMEKVSKNDKKRIIRILEIYHSTGKTKTELEGESKKKGVKYDYKVFAINWEREKLYDRINKRVDLMFEQGLEAEVIRLLEKYKEYPTAMQAIGYKEVKEYLDGKISKEDGIDKIKQETRRYAKRQVTWFKKNNPIWLNGEKSFQNNIDIILNNLNEFREELP